LQDKEITQLKIANKNYNWLIAVVIIFPYLLIFQGLDFTDAGYSLTNYQQIFIEPSSIQNSFACWLTNIIGGIWIKVSGSLGLFGAKLGGALVISITCYLSYLILKDYIKKEFLLLGLLLAEIFAFSSTAIILNYNILTAFFFTISVYFLSLGIFKKQYMLLFLSGFFAGLNIFIRFPNILGILLVVVIFFYGYLKKIKISAQIKQSLIFLAGWFISIITAVIIMNTLGHYKLYSDSLLNLFKMGISSELSHSGMSLIKRLIIDHLYILQYAFTALLGTVIISKLFNKIKKNKYLKYGIFLVFAILISCVTYRINHYFLYGIIGMLYTTLLFYIFNFQKINVNMRALSSIALLILFITPLGSNTGLWNARQGMWLALPISFSFILQICEFESGINLKIGLDRIVGKFKMTQQEILFAKNIILIFCFTFMLIFSFKYTYGNTTNRLAMHYSINHPRLKMVYTTKERAKVVEELLGELSKYVHKGEYLFTFEQISLLHYLTKTKPYLYNSWPILYRPEEFKVALEKAIREKEDLPVIVRAKRGTGNFEWPNNPEVEFTEPKQHIDNRSIVKEFMDKYCYKTIWENDFFQILLPGKEQD